MARRVSVKGQGANLFFGETRPPDELPIAPEPPASAAEDPKSPLASVPSPTEASGAPGVSSPRVASDRPTGTPGVRPPVRSEERPSARTDGRRVITRYAFEFFQDQVDELHRRSLEAKLAGETGSMSEMVREAMDRYLAATRRTDERGCD